MPDRKYQISGSSASHPSGRSGPTCCVVIPIYRESPLKTECASLERAAQTLADRRIIFVTHEELNPAEYLRILKPYGVQFEFAYFPKYYFAGISGYNALMYAPRFYERFLDYDYILLYQLDSWVFSPNLDHWLSLDYDYLGGPWFEEIKHTMTLKWSGCFNGGLCLRKTAVFYRLCFDRIIQLNKRFWELQEQRRMMRFGAAKIFSFFKMFLLKAVNKLFKSEIGNEDVIWTRLLKQKGKLPSLEEALEFCFADFYAEYAFELNKRALPSFCHDWDGIWPWKFWQNYITAAPA
ncbi:MAG: hypothetical protein LBR23_09360 [Spirochaetaceae bacterium]|jgi:hypothetical protein|nr:hypothetical protein [Spirochaetaceae bacterium]